MKSSVKRIKHQLSVVESKWYGKYKSIMEPNSIIASVDRVAFARPEGLCMRVFGDDRTWTPFSDLSEDRLLRLVQSLDDLEKQLDSELERQKSIDKELEQAADLLKEFC